MEDHFGLRTWLAARAAGSSCGLDYGLGLRTKTQPFSGLRRIAKDRNPGQSAIRAFHSFGTTIGGPSCPKLERRRHWVASAPASPRRRCIFTGRLRSLSRRAIAARSSGMPAPVWEDVAMVSKSCRPLFKSRFCRFDAGCQIGHADPIAFGQNDLMADGGLAERIENGVVGAFEPMAGVNQHVDAAQNGAALQIVVDQSGPRRNLLLAAAA